MNYGRVVVFRKGKSSAPYELEEGTHTIGSSPESNIRLKFTHPLLLATHALIQVSEDGIATLTNKSVGAPVRVNGKPILASTILRHEDKFEVLEKVFQYFNESLIDETESDRKIVKEKRNILAKKSRQSVNPLIKTPAKKSPNLKTKIPSLRKTMSDVKTASQPRSSFQVLVTPNNRLERNNGSKTMSKIIVSKALGAPSSKKRLSLDTSVKKSQSPQISSRNILLSRSTINITISEEHEYTKLTPSKSMRTIQEYDLLENNEIETKSRTPRKSVKLEKDDSMCLIGFGTPDAPAVNTPDKKTPLKRQSNIKADATDDSTSNIMNTPVNKRIQSLKNVRHSLKKDTPPPISSVPKIIVQAPTPQRRSSLRKTISATTSEDSDILVTFSPNAEPSKHNHSRKESTTPRKSVKKFEESGDQPNKSRVSFAVEAPNENSNLDFEAMNVSYHLVDEENTGKGQLSSLRKSTNVLNENSEPPKSRRSTRYSLSSSKKLEDPLETSVSKKLSTLRTSIGYGNNPISMQISAGIKKSLNTSADESLPEEDTSAKGTSESRKKLNNENAEDNLLNNSLPVQTAGAFKTQKRSLRYSNNKSILSATNDSFSYSPNVSADYSNNTSKVSVSNDLVSEDENLAEPLERSLNSSKSSRNVELNSTKSSMSDLDIDAISDRLEKSLNSLEDVSSTKNKSTSNNSSEEMDELYVDKTVYSSRSRTSTIPEKAGTPQMVSTTTKKSLGTNSRRSLQKVDVTSSEEMDELCVDETVYSSKSRTSTISTIPEKSRTSQNLSTMKKPSLNNTRNSEKDQNVDASSSDEMDELCVDETVYSSGSRTSTISTIPEKSRTSQNMSVTKNKSLGNTRKSKSLQNVDASSSEEMDELCVDGTFRSRTSTAPEKSRMSQNVSTTSKKSLSNNRKSEKGETSDANSSEEMDDLCVNELVYSSRTRTSTIPEKSRTSQDASRLSSRLEKSLGASRNDVTSSPKVANNSLRLSRNNSRKSFSALQDDGKETEGNSFNVSRKSSRLSKNASRQNVGNSTDLSADEDNGVELEENISEVLAKSRSISPTNNSVRLSRNNSRKSVSGLQDDGKETEGNSFNVSRKSSRLSKNASRLNAGNSTDVSADEDNGVELEENISEYLAKSGSISPTNNSVRLSRNNSRKSFSALQDDGKETEGNSFNVSRKSSRLSKNASRLNVDNCTDLSADEDNAVKLKENVSEFLAKHGSYSLPVGDEDLSLEQVDTNITEKRSSRSSRLSRNISQRNVQPEISTIEVNHVSGIYNSGMFGELDDSTQTDEEKESSSRMSRNTSRRSTNTSIKGNSGLSGNYSGRSKLLRNSSQTDENSTDNESISNTSSRISRNSSRLSKSNVPLTAKNETINKSRSLRSLGIGDEGNPLLVEDTTTDEDDNIGNDTSSSAKASFKGAESSVGKNSFSRSGRYSRRSTLQLQNSSQTINKSVSSGSVGTEDANTTDENNIGNKSSRLSRNKSGNGAAGSQSSIDSAETTMDTHQIEGKEASRSAKGKSGQRLSLFDESTQEATPAENVSRVSRGQTRQRSSIFEGSTKEALAEVSQSKSGTSLVILDDTHEVLSPVRPLSPRKSIRSAQLQGLEGSISPSARTSSIRRSRSKSHNLQDSSLTMTSMDKISSSMISVSSQSFSSFKKGPSKAEETEIIDVVNVSSVVDATETRRSVRRSGGVTSEVVVESKVSRSIQRQSLPSDMFKDVSCTSTPFHKQNVGKKSRTTAESNSTTGSKAISRKSSRQLEMFSISSDSVFADSPSDKNGSVSKVGGDSDVPRRRSSSRSSIFKKGEHNCISCRNSSAKRSRSASESSAGRRSSSSSLINRSKTARKSSGSVLEQGYEETSPVKRHSSSLANKATPLLHRKSSVIILSEGTPEKTAETEDETPKSSIKPARRSSKANQSAYNPLLEDITPVTPEKLMVSGFTEEAFKTPINTPGLFESIRKSVIRSRKRHRESTGSVMKASKRARIELPNEDHDQVLDDDTQEYVQMKPQRSPANRLSDFEGVKELMTTPPTSVATRRISSKNDLTNVPKIKQQTEITSPGKSLRQSPLTKIASPRHQKSPRNKSVSLDGVKQLLKTPRTQKEPVNDLTNVSGVGNLFNLSGVEVLHQGSDIENSEDLFTKVTGKRPVRAYHHRGHSMSPDKVQQQEGRSRKTMGDLPICSPRVQQWVDDHANVMYTETEDGSNVPVSEYEEELLKVSDRPRLKSRCGRSVSPKKQNQYGSGRRKTQGDALRHTPNVKEWRDDETKRVNARKLSVVTKTEPTTPNTNQILPVNNLKIENVTPLQRKSSLKQVTPQHITPQHITPLVKVAKVTPKSQKSTETKLTPQQLTPLLKVVKTTPQSQKSTVSQPIPQQKTSQRDTVTPASVRARIVRQTSSNKQTTDHELVSTSSIETKRVSVSKDQETPKTDRNILLEPPKRGGHTKRIRSNEELDIVTSTTDSPDQEPQIRETRSRRGVADDVKPKTTAKGKRGQKINDQKSTEQSPIKELVIQIKEIDHNVPAAKGRRGKQAELSKEELDVKPKVRGGRSKKADEQILNLKGEEPSPEVQVTKVLVKPTVRGKRGKKANEDVVLQDEEQNTEVLKKLPVRGKRGKKANEDLMVHNEELSTEEQDTEKIKKLPVRGKRGKKANVDLIVQNDKLSTEEQDTEEATKLPVKGKRGRKENEVLIVPIEEISTDVAKKLPVRGKKGKKANEVLSVQNEEVSTEEVKKLPVRGKRGKKKAEHLIVQNEESSTEEHDTEVLKKPIVRGKRGRKANEDLSVQTEDLSTEEHNKEVPKKPTRGGRRGKKLDDDLIVQNDEPSTEEQDSEVLKKPPIRGKRGKKANEDVVVKIEKPSLEKQETEVLKKPPVRGRRGKKVNEDLVVQNEEPSAEEQEPQEVKKPTGRGKKANEVVHSEEPVAEQLNIEAKVQKPVAKKTRGKKVDDKEVLDESDTDFDDPEVEVQPKSTAKGKRAAAKGRGKKAEETPPETVTSTQVSTKRNLRNKVIEEVKEMEVDSPRTARAKRGTNKKYSTDEYEVADLKAGSKRKVHFEDSLKGESTHAIEIDTRKSKRLRK